MPSQTKILTGFSVKLLMYSPRKVMQMHPSCTILTGIQVGQMFHRMVFNIVCANKDNHAKNFSFLCENGKRSLAPEYDITYSPEGTRGEHATSVRYS